MPRVSAKKVQKSDESIILACFFVTDIQSLIKIFSIFFFFFRL
jgi:hypothetical protein